MGGVVNIVELYKQLPRQDCGECRYRTCMPFALALVRGETEAIDCPHLTPEKSTALQQSIVRSDWREDLIRRLQDDIRTISFQEIAKGIGAELKDGMLVIPCFGREFTVSPDGQIHTASRIT